MSNNGSKLLSAFVTLLVWGIVLPCAFYRYTNIFGLCGIVAGVLSASLVHAFLVGRHSRALLGVIFGSGALSVGLVWALQHTSWLNIDVQMEMFQVAIFFELALIFIVSVCYVTALWPGLRYAEAAFLVVMSSNLVSAHRHGLIQRPFWFYDVFVERGVPSVAVLEGFSALIFLLLCVRLAMSSVSPTSLANINDKWRSSFRMIVEVIVLWLLCVAVAHTVPPPALGISIPPPPPAAPDGPPPPPPPRNIALVKFQAFNMPPPRLGAYYFRVQPEDERRISTISDRATSDGKVTMTVHMFADGDKLPLLINLESLSKGSVGPAPFVSSYTVRSEPIGGTELKDVDLAYDLGDLGQRFTSTTWDHAAEESMLDYGSDERLRTLVNDILQRPVSSGNLTPEYIIVKLKEWLGKKCSLSQKRSEEIKEGDLSSFLYGDHIGGSREFADAFVRMLRVAGVPARRALGYVFSLPEKNVSGQNFKEAILLTDQHIEQWAEIYLEGSGWLPIPIIYENIIDKADPPPQQDLEDLLANMTPKGDSKLLDKQVAAHPGRFVARLLLGLLCFVVIALALALVAYPIFAGVTERTGQRLLRFSVRLLQSVGYRRKFGESWEDFALRLSRRRPRSAKAFAKLLSIQKTFVYDRQSITRTRWIGTYFKMLSGLIVDPFSLLYQEWTATESPARL